MEQKPLTHHLTKEKTVSIQHSRWCVIKKEGNNGVPVIIIQFIKKLNMDNPSQLNVWLSHNLFATCFLLYVMTKSVKQGFSSKEGIK